MELASANLAVITTIFPRIYARTYYAHPRARVMSFSASVWLEAEEEEEEECFCFWEPVTK